MRDMRRWLPVAVLAAGLALSAWAWHATRTAVHDNIRRALTGSATLHAGLLLNDFNEARSSLVRSSRRWAALSGPNAETWRSDAAGRIGIFIGVDAVDRLDAGLNLLSHTTAAGEQDINQPANLTAPERARLDAGHAQDAITMGDVKTGDGAAFVMMYVPLFASGQFDGFAAWRLDLKAMLGVQVKKTGTSNHLELRSGGSTLAMFGDTPDNQAVAEFTGSAPAAFDTAALEIVALPTTAFLMSNRQGLPGAILVLGTIFTLLVTGLAYLSAKLADRARAVRAAHELTADKERRYRELLRRADLGYFVSELDGTVVSVNEPGVRMLGRKDASEMVGRPVTEFLPAGGNEWRKDHIAGAMKAEGAVHRELTVTRPNGEELLLSVNTIVDQSADGETRLISLAQDITEATRAQRQIVESKRIYEEIFENADVAIVDADMARAFQTLTALRNKGVTDLAAYLDADIKRLHELCRACRINNMNRAGLRLFGADSVAHLRTIDYFMEKGRPEQVREFMLGIWHDLAGLRREVAYSTFTGKDIALIYSLRLPKTLEQARRVPIVVLDITEVRSAEGAKQASVAKSQFLASMSHEIRTPLNGVIGNLELLAATDLRADQEELLFDAEKAAKSLLALIGNILDFSKIEAGKLTIESVELNPAVIVQEAIDILQSRARQKGIFVTGLIGPDVPEIVKGDPTRIRQILLNLLGNSVKFTSQGGVHVNLKVKDWDDSICQLLFTVHDSGRGFDQSVADELFLPFTQDTKRAADDFGGTGLGLSICKSLVDSFGGEISCEAARGHGASFWFTLPVQVVRPAAPVVKPDITGHSVLFINTDIQNLPTTVMEYLVKRGAMILTAADEDTALSMSRKAMHMGAPIDLAIYVTKRTQWPTSSLADAFREVSTVPIVFAPEASPEVWRKALRSGASYLLPENFDPAFFDRNAHFAFGGLDKGDRAQPRENTVVFDAALLAGKNVLVLEDRLVNQTIIQRQLKKFQMTCTLAGDGIVGLEKLAQGTFDLILCDCSMPEMNGFEFTRILRQREAEKGDGTHMPVIAMTANAFREDREKCFAAGMDDFVSKPVTMHRLASVLTTWLSKGPQTEIVSESNGATHLPRAKPEPKRNDSAAVDLSLLENLIGTSDQNVLSEIMGEFLAAADESWREVQVSAEKRDPVEITKAAHGAKGEARNVGAVALGDLYEELEHNARQSDLSGLDALMTAIPRELQRVRSFASEIASRKAG